MAVSWGSLYLPFADRETLLTCLQDTLVSAGFELYDPFGLIPGKAYPHTQRFFVAPAMQTWTRIVGLPQLEICKALSQFAPCLSLELDGTEALIDVFQHGEQVDPQSALIPYLRDGVDPNRLEHALTATNLSIAPRENSGGTFTNLPDDVQALAGDVDMAKAQQMFDRLSGGLMKKMGQRTGTDSESMSEAAKDLIGGNAPDWNSVGGARLSTLMACLTIDENWREPDFTSLRDAYQLHNRRQRNPNARLYPGDAEAMAKVPDALDYTPVYGGKTS